MASTSPPNDTSVRHTIETKLQDIAGSENVEYLIAVESGSRAWGFPSPDSDYDVRFIYRQPRERYLSLFAARNVIERPIVDDFDVSGWDIAKTLRLLLKHNAVVSEWINSPIRYRDDHPAVATLGAIVDAHFDPRGYALHYASLAENNAKRWKVGAPTIQVKRYFYALRPALAARAIRLNPLARPPMALPELMAACGLSREIEGEIANLVALKSVTREASPVHRSHAIEALVLTEIARAAEVQPRRQDDAFRAVLDEFFLDLINEG